MKKSMTKLFAGVLMAAVVFSACSQKPEVEGAVAKVGEEYVMEEDVQAVLDQYKQFLGEDAFDETTDQGKTNLVQYRPEIVNQLVRQKLVDQLAGEYDLTVTDDEIDGQMEMLKLQLQTEDQTGDEALAAALEEEGLTEEELRNQMKESLEQQKLSEKIVEENQPSDEEVEEGYKKNSAKEVEYDADHILISTRDPETNEPYDDETIKEKEKEAQAVYEEVIKEGADFAAIAKEKSDEPAAAESGGSLGKFLGTVMIEDFTNALSKMKVGDISKPVITDFGYHIIRLNDKQTEVENFSEENQNELKNRVREELLQENMDKFFEEKEKELGVVRYK